MQSFEAFSSTNALSLSTFLTGATTWILTMTMSYTAGEMSDRRMVVRHKDLKDIMEAIKEYFDKEAAAGDQVSETLEVGRAQLDWSFRQLNSESLSSFIFLLSTWKNLFGYRENVGKCF